MIAASSYYENNWEKAGNWHRKIELKSKENKGGFFGAIITNIKPMFLYFG
jgi:hypothetical protein